MLNIKAFLEIEIPDSLMAWGGTFSVTDNNEIILAYNHSYNKTPKTPNEPEGKLVRIKRNDIQTIFETHDQLMSPVIDGDDIYVSTYSMVLDMDTGEATKGIMYKINSLNSIEWQHELEGEIRELPVIYQDSIFITDFSRVKLRTSEKNSNLYRLNKKGKLLSKTAFFGGMGGPLIMKNREHFVFDSGKTKSIILMDIKGNIKKEIPATNPMLPLFSQEYNGVFFGAFNDAIVALDENLNIYWEYKPVKGFPAYAPVIEAQGNLYTYCNLSRLVSISPDGKERWIVDSPGDGNQPCVLSDGNILTVKWDNIPAKPTEEHEITYLNLFSPSGERIAYSELPGGSEQAVQSKDGTIYIATRSHLFNRNIGQIWGVKLYSLQFT